VASSSLEQHVTTGDYLTLPETNRPSELVYGVVREPPAPFYGHQKVVGELFRILKSHVSTGATASFGGSQSIQSRVLPDLKVPASDCFR
jgi:hypothetical protein